MFWSSSRFVSFPIYSFYIVPCIKNSDEVAELSEDDPDDDLPLLQLLNILYSAEDLSDEIEVIDLYTEEEIVSEVEVITLDEEVAISEKEIVAGSSVVSNKRKVENRVFVVVNKKPRTN